jgi:hypothetical protein
METEHMPRRSEMVEDLKDLKQAIDLFDERRWGATHPAYVAVRKEIDVLEKRLAGDVDLRTSAMLASHHGDGLAFGAATRGEMAEVLASHETYHEQGRTYMSWNIKLRDHIEASDEEFDFNPEFDERWDELVQRENGVFDEAVENILRRYLEGEYVAAGDANERKARFDVTGRSNGHLILTRFELPDGKRDRKSFDVSTAGDAEMRAWIMDEMEDEEIVALYNLVVSVDADVEERYRLVASELGYLRSREEESWAAEQTDGADPSP